MVQAGLTYLVTGTSRGIGLEYVKQLLDRPQVKVIAAARHPETAFDLQEMAKEHPERLIVVQMDVTNEESVMAAAEKVEKQCPNGVDILVNNAAINNGSSHTVLETTVKSFEEVLTTNITGPFSVTLHFLPLMRKGTRKLIVNLSSTMGSITHLQEGLRTRPEEPPRPFDVESIAYKTSKAGLNMQTTVFAYQLKDEGFTVVSLHPGWVDTILGRGDGTRKPDLKVDYSVDAQLKIIDRVTTAQNGLHLSYRGDIIPW